MAFDCKIFRLGDIAIMKYGKLPPKDETTGEYPIFSGYRVIGSTSTYNTNKDTPIVVARGVGGTGDVKILKQNCFLTNLAISVNVDRSICNPYYFYYRHLLKNLKWLDSGAAQSQITIEDLSKLKLCLPPVNYQAKIVSILSAYDDLIENNNKRIKILEKMAENLYKEWFVRFRFPGHSRGETKQVKPKGWVLSSNSAYIECPKSWGFNEFIKIGKFVRGKNITADNMITGEIPVISAGIEPSGYHNACNVNGQSITISASGANAGYLKYHQISIWAADCSYCQDSNKLWFLYHSLKFLQPVISNMQTGAAQPHVYPKHINKLYTIIPDEEILLKFQEVVSPIYDSIKLLREKNTNLTKQRDMLLPRLMSGKLEV